MSAPSPPPPPATISGRRMTVVVLMTLLATGLLFYWVATAYGTYNAARRQTDRTWRALAAVLDQRYEDYDAQIARALTEDKIDAATGEHWQAARDSFLRTTITTHQIDAAQKLEETIAGLPQPLRLPEETWPKLRELYNDFDSAAKSQRQVGQNAGSRMLKLMLRLPEPSEFSLAQ